MNSSGQDMRQRLIETLSRRWRKSGGKRGAMRLILLVTGLAGFAASAGLLRMGMDEMYLRYPLAMLAGWLVFLFLVRIWAGMESSPFRTEEDIDALADSAMKGPRPTYDTALESDRSAWKFLDGLNPFEFLGSGEGCLVGLAFFVVLLALGGAFVAIGGLIGSAEVIFAEVVLDAVLVTALYRRLQHLETRWWMEGVLNKTAGPVVGTMLFLGVAGFCIQTYAPEVRSIGGIWKAIHHTPAQR